jgi:DNA-binding MarR family transcriptional regulator
MVASVRTRRKIGAVPNTTVAGKAAGYVLEDQIGFVLRCAHQRATEVFNGVMGRFGVTPTQFAALTKIDDLGAVSQNHLGRLTAMDPATISGVVGRLAGRGFVRQSADASDARRAVLELTPAGRSAITAMKAEAGEVSRRTLAGLSTSEAALLLRMLAKIGEA